MLVEESALQDYSQERRVEESERNHASSFIEWCVIEEMSPKKTIHED